LQFCGKQRKIKSIRKRKNGLAMLEKTGSSQTKSKSWTSCAAAMAAVPVTAHYCGEEDAYEFDESLLERTAAGKRTIHTVTAKALNKSGRDHSFVSS
jgi:uncharacterized membrane protein